jgi:hypothetical protein
VDVIVKVRVDDVLGNALSEKELKIPANRLFNDEPWRILMDQVREEVVQAESDQMIFAETRDMELT